MMILGYLLLLLIPIGAIAMIVWSYKRRADARDRASAGRMIELLGVAEQARGAPEPALHPQASIAPDAVTLLAGAPPSAAAEVKAAPAEALYAARDRVLSAPQTLLYYLLRTGIPDHVIFPRVSLSALLDAGPGLSGIAREEQVRRLSAINVDFLITDKSMRPVTVVELSAVLEGGAAQADRESARDRLAAAGVRYLEIDPRAMPRKEAIRAMVLGIDAAQTPPSAAEEVSS